MNMFETIRRIDQLNSQRSRTELMEAQQYGRRYPAPVGSRSIAYHSQLPPPGFHAVLEALNGASRPGSISTADAVGVRHSH
jgi:hypothetical protein